MDILGNIWLQNHRTVGVGRDHLCGSSSPTPIPKQGHLQQAAQDLVQAGLRLKLLDTKKGDLILLYFSVVLQMW